MPGTSHLTSQPATNTPYPNSSPAPASPICSTVVVHCLSLAQICLQGPTAAELLWPSVQSAAFHPHTVLAVAAHTECQDGRTA
jgi:hypothetical protein